MRPLAVLPFALAAGALVPAAAPAQTPAPTPAEILRAETPPLPLSELPAGYRPVILDESSMVGLSLLRGIASPTSMRVVAALPHAVWVDPDEWTALLEGRARSIRGLAFDLARLADAARSRDPLAVPALRWRTILAGSVGIWRGSSELTPTAIADALRPGGSVAASSPQGATLSNVKRLSITAIILLGDLDDRYPRVDSTAEMRRLLHPYTKNDEIWKTQNPNGGRILYNVALSGIDAASLENPAATPIFWEERAWPDGTRVVGFTDGHAKRLAAAEWERIWQDEERRRERARRSGRS